MVQHHTCPADRKRPVLGASLKLSFPEKRDVLLSNPCMRLQALMVLMQGFLLWDFRGFGFVLFLFNPNRHMDLAYVKKIALEFPVKIWFALL